MEKWGMMMKMVISSPIIATRQDHKKICMQPSPQPPPAGPTSQQKWEAFTAGSLAVLKRWTALSLAVENGWGGQDSAEKRDWLYQQILQMAHNPNLEADDIEVFLEDIMEEEFHTDCQDGSVKEVALELFQLHRGCIAGDFSRAAMLVASKPVDLAYSKADPNQNDEESNDGEEGGNDNDDDEGMMDDDNAAAAAAAGNSNEIKAPKQPQLTAEQLADIDDGWQIAGKRR